MNFTQFEKLSLKVHPTLTEKWVQERIAENPSILGLGDVVLKDKERIQPRAGRLDLLLQAAEGIRLLDNEAMRQERASVLQAQPTLRAHRRPLGPRQRLQTQDRRQRLGLHYFPGSASAGRPWITGQVSEGRSDV